LKHSVYNAKTGAGKHQTRTPAQTMAGWPHGMLEIVRLAEARNTKLRSCKVDYARQTTTFHRSGNCKHSLCTAFVNV